MSDYKICDYKIVYFLYCIQKVAHKSIIVSHVYVSHSHVAMKFIVYKIFSFIASTTLVVLDVIAYLKLVLFRLKNVGGTQHYYFLKSLNSVLKNHVLYFKC